MRSEKCKKWLLPLAFLIWVLSKLIINGFFSKSERADQVSSVAFAGKKKKEFKCYFCPAYLTTVIFTSNFL